MKGGGGKGILVAAVVCKSGFYGIVSDAVYRHIARDYPPIVAYIKKNRPPRTPIRITVFVGSDMEFDGSLGS